MSGWWWQYPLVVSVSLVAFTALAADLDVKRSVENNGNATLTIVNVDQAPITIDSIQINHSNKAFCNLVPIASNFDTAFMRSDLFDEGNVSFPDQRKVDSVSLAYGETASAHVFRGCGAVLAVDILTNAGIGSFEFEP